MLPYGIAKTVTGKPPKRPSGIGRSRWNQHNKTVFRYLERKRKKTARQHAKREIQSAVNEIAVERVNRL